MAYTDVEAGGRRFRFMYLSHDRPADPRQVPPSVNAIMSEGGSSRFDGQFTLLEHGGLYTEPENKEQVRATDFDTLRALAQDKNIPVVSIEPLMRSSEIENFVPLSYREDELKYNSPAIFIGWFLSRFVHRLKGEIRREGAIYKYLSAFAQEYETVLPQGMLGIRDLVMADMAVAFAERQKGQDYLIGAGLMHFGIVNALQMDNSERIAAIRNDQRFEQLYDRKLSHQGVYIKPVNDHWGKAYYQNKRFKHRI